MHQEKDLDIEENIGYSRRLLKRVAARMRNRTQSRDPEMDVLLRALVPVTLCGAIYCFARSYVILEGSLG